MSRYVKFLFLPIAICVLMAVNLSITDDHEGFVLNSCSTIFNSAEAGVFPESIVNKHELAFEYPEMHDAGTVALCYNLGFDCLFEGDTPDLYDN